MRANLWTLTALLTFGCGGSEAQSTKTGPLPAATAAPERGIGDFPKLNPARDWPWWRGGSRSGIAPAEAAPPVRFGESENVAWRAAVPGRGHASPTIVGDRVFLATADEAAQVQSVVAFDRAGGRQLWKTDVSRGGFPRAIHAKNTHATPTVACDGERLIVVFFHHETAQATALDFDGKQLWQVTAGPFNPQRYEYGYAPSPVLFEQTVIVTSEYDGDSFLAALDRASGREVWRAKRPNNISFSPPVVAHVAGRDQLLLSGADAVSSYDPNSGELLWSTKGTTAATCGTMVWDGDLVFASGGYPKSETCAVKADGSGTVVWKNNQKCYEQSMITVGGYLYALTDGGVMFCFRNTDGQEMWRERLRGPVSSSPVFAGGHIYWANEAGTYYVFKPNHERFELVAEIQLGSEAFASPAVGGRQLFLRTSTHVDGRRQEWLYCFEAK